MGVSATEKTTFLFEDSSAGARLWATDGTVEGTEVVARFEASPSDMLADADALYFVIDGTLWRSDGTAGGTTALFAQTGTPCRDTMALVDGTLYWLVRTDGGSGLVLVKSDGSVHNTSVVATWSGNVSRCFPIEAGSKYVYFTATTEETGAELWMSDGTPAGR